MLAIAFAIATGVAWAQAPSVADLDAHARAGGNRKDLALGIGERVYATEWPAQVFQILVNEVGTHVVIGMRVSGTHFHEGITRDQFDGEIATLARDAFAVVPHAEEIDIWTTVPIRVGKDVIVSGDLAKPTMRDVFTISIHRHETAAGVAERLRSGRDVFVDQEWAQTAFKKMP
ncbi:MAG: hypothetical protein KGN02_01035 [bacterium]|nr:hypothetical protein [bacterium]